MWSQFWFCFWWETGNDQISIFAIKPFISDWTKHKAPLARWSLSASHSLTEDHCTYIIHCSYLLGKMFGWNIKNIWVRGVAVGRKWVTSTARVSAGGWRTAWTGVKKLLKKWRILHGRFLPDSFTLPLNFGVKFGARHHFPAEILQMGQTLKRKVKL